MWHEATNDGPAPDWMHYMNQSEVDCLAANAYIELALQDVDRPRWQLFAERHTVRACQSRGSGYARSRIFDELRLAKVRLAQREPVESAAVGRSALNLAEHTRSSLVVDWLVSFDDALLTRYPDPPAVADFHDQLRDYLRKAAPRREAEISGHGRH